MPEINIKTTISKSTDLKIYFCVLLLFLLLQIPAAGQNIYVVNTTSDLRDNDLADEHCADKNGECSLRAAIENANKSPKKDKIHFAIPGIGPFEIMLRENLPAITEPIELNATTQPSYSEDKPKIILNGKKTPLLTPRFDEDTSPIGFHLTGKSDGSTIKGFIIGGFGYVDLNKRIGYSGAGIFIKTAKNIIQSNYIGLAANGSCEFRNLFGIVIHGNNNLVGGDKPRHKNIISANHGGILSYSNNHFKGNFIGTDATGNKAVGNLGGISLVVHSENNIIENNLISGNTEGINIPGDRNYVYKNKIGTNHTGKEKLPNEIGIKLKDATQNIIGNGNLISGNKVGILLDFYRLKVPQNNHIWGNLIGTDESGKQPISNETGIYIRGCNNNKIGGANIGHRNVISGNKSAGILISEAKENNIAGNYIGTDITGETALPNSIGIEFSGEPGKELSSNNSIYENLISGNEEDGVQINYATGNSIFCNLIGTAADGFSPLPNCGNGIKIAQNSFGNCVGSTDPANLNIISFNNQNGILISAPAKTEAERLKNQILPNKIFGNQSFSILFKEEEKVQPVKVRK